MYHDYRRAEPWPEQWLLIERQDHRGQACNVAFLEWTKIPPLWLIVLIVNFTVIDDG